MFGPELPLKEVKPKVSSPSLPSKTFSRAKRERIRKGLIGERTLKKEEKKARQAARRAEKRLARGGDGERKAATKRVYRCKESVDATIRKVLGKTAKTKVAAKSEVNGEKVGKGTPGSNSSMRNTSHEARQERKVKGPMKLSTPSNGSRVSLFPQPDTSNARSVSNQVTICDVGPEEWLEMDLPPANSQEEQVTLELLEPCNVESLPPPVAISDIGMEEWQPAPQCSLLSKSESGIERGSEVSAECPKKSKKDGKAAADPQLTDSSDEEEKPPLTKFPKRKKSTKSKKPSLSSTSKRRTSILESRSEGGVSTETAKHSKDKGRTDELPEDSETPKQLKEEPPNLTDSSEEEVDEEDVKPRPASSGNMRGGAGVSARSVLTFNELIQIAIDGKQPPLKLDAETAGDGSCFSHATCQQCERPGVKLYLQSRGIRIRDIFHLKQQVREFVERNSQSEKILNLKRNFMLSRKIPMHLLSRSWTQYWEEMQKRKTWADDVFLWCTAFFLKVDLRIIFAGAETEGQADTVVSGKFTEDDVEDLPVLYYGYVVDLHYQSLIPVEEAPITLKCLEKKSIDSTLDQVLRALKHPSSQQGNEVSRRKLLYFIFYM